MFNYEAIVFDMDGVIVDSEPRHEQAFHEIWQELGYGKSHGIDFSRYIGRTDKELWLDFIAIHKPKQTLEELISLKQQRLIQIIRHLQPLFPEVEGLMEKLKGRYKMALASGSVHAVIDEVLAMRNLRRFFPVIVSVQDVAKGKPAPDVFLRAAQLLHISAAKCCVIEDSAAGVEAARAAGMGVIAITNTLPQDKLSRANHVVADYGEIERLLLS
jgi:HAD superfamily hydrolase (TIGR01509 family)